MAHVRRVVVVQIVLLVADLSAARAGSEFDAKATGHFTPRWSQVTSAESHN
jgi:hypothetical protein